MPVLPPLERGNTPVTARGTGAFQKVSAENYTRNLGRSFSGFAQAIRDCALFLFPAGGAGLRASAFLHEMTRRNEQENQLDDCIKNKKNYCANCALKFSEHQNHSFTEAVVKTRSPFFYNHRQGMEDAAK